MFGPSFVSFLAIVLNPAGSFYYDRLIEILPLFFWQPF